MSGNILVVEDDNYLRDFVAGRLDKAGFKSEKACNGEEALHLLKKGYFDLIVMDLELGDMNGKDIILLIRKQSIDIPIIVMSTFNNLNVKLDSFGVGCDDYVTKPFYIDELIARVNRHIKRTKQVSTAIVEDQYVDLGDFAIDFANCSIIKDGEKNELPRKIFELLSFLYRNKNVLISKEILFERFWDSDGFPENSLSVHMHKLRTIIEKDPKNPKYIQTKKGMGYCFNYEADTI